MSQHPLSLSVILAAKTELFFIKEMCLGLDKKCSLLFKNRDILVDTVAATIAGAISYIGQMAQWAAIFGGRSNGDNRGGNPIAALIMMIVGPIAAVMIQMAISRSREYGADTGGAKIAGNPLHLSNALKKLHLASQRIPMDANPVTSHMFIVNPLSGGGLLKLFGGVLGLKVENIVGDIIVVRALKLRCYAVLIHGQ